MEDDASGEFMELIMDLEEFQRARPRMEKALGWIEEQQQAEDRDRLRRIDQELSERDGYGCDDRSMPAQEPRPDVYKSLMADLSPQARRARAERLREAGDLSGITRQLEAMAPDNTDSSHTAAKALNPAYFAAAWRTLASAEASGEATPEQLRKAADILHTSEYGAMMENVGDGDISSARDHLRILTQSGAFESPEQAARIERSINNPTPRTMIKAQPTLTRNPALAEIVLADAWGAIPPAGHQKR